VGIYPPSRSDLVGVVSRLRTARIKLLFSAGQVPPLSAVLGERGETFEEFEEVRVPLGELPKDLY